jgi:hypothetical protein
VEDRCEGVRGGSEKGDVIGGESLSGRQVSVGGESGMGEW